MGRRSLNAHWLLACLAAGAAPAGDAPLALPTPDARPGPAAAEAGRPLGLEELVQLALQRTPTVAQAADRLEQARGRARQAGAYPNPLFIWSATNWGDEGTAGSQQGFFQQPIILGGKLRVNRARYEVDVESARVAIDQERIRVRNGVRVRYLQLVAQQRILGLRSGLARLADEVVETTRAKVETGHASEPDLLTAENAADEARLDLDQLAERRHNTWRAFAAFLGCPEMPLATLDGTLEGELHDLSWEPLLDRLLRESPEMRIAGLQVARAELTLDRERREPIPDLVLRGGAGHDPVSGQTTGYTQVYVEVPIWDQNRGNIRTARNGLMELRRDVDRVRLGLQQRLARDFNHYQTSLANVRRYRGEILPRARRAFELYYRRFREEESDFSRVQSSQASYLSTSIKEVEELLELRRAEAAIEGFHLIEQDVEVGTLRPPGSGGLGAPGQGVGRAPSGGGVPVGRPTRNESP